MYSGMQLEKKTWFHQKAYPVVYLLQLVIPNQLQGYMDGDFKVPSSSVFAQSSCFTAEVNFQWEYMAYVCVWLNNLAVGFLVTTYSYDSIPARVAVKSTKRKYCTDIVRVEAATQILVYASALFYITCARVCYHAHGLQWDRRPHIDIITPIST